jgi:hypothetical protein
VNLGIGLDSQLATCVSNVSGLVGKGAKFSSCFTTFAQGLLSPSEQAQLRILSASSQSKVSLYVTGIVAGVNIIVAFIAPPVGPAPSASELRDLRQHVLQGMK